MYLMEQASQLVTEWDNSLLIVVPDSLDDAWNTTWPTTAKIQFIGMLARAHISVRPEAWRNGKQVLLRSLWRAVQDPEEYVSTTAAKVLAALAPTVGELQWIFEDKSTARAEATEAHDLIIRNSRRPNYFPRIPQIVSEIERWRSKPPRELAFSRTLRSVLKRQA
jgi:hypothetical protein